MTTTLTVSDVTIKTLDVLSYLRNDDGCWGELKTQASRLTNTSEVLWCLSFIKQANKDAFEEAIPDIDKTLDKVAAGILGKNISVNKSQDFTNCEIARDYAWALIALLSWDKVDKNTISHVIKRLRSLQTGSGGFYTRGETTPSLFNSGIVSIGLCNLYSKLPLISRSAVMRAHIKEILLKLAGFFVHEIPHKHNHDNLDEGEFSYAYYAMALLRKNDLIDSNHSIWDTLEHLALKVDLSSYTEENKSRDKKPGTHRPYRHFANVWLLLAAVELNSKISARFATKLFGNFSPQYGWKFNNLGYQISWVNAIAFVAFYKYLSTVNPIELIFYNHNQTEITTDAKHDTMAIDKKKVFIVHGNSREAELDVLRLSELLEKQFGLIPIVAMKQPSLGIETVLQKVRRLIKDCFCAIVLLTPDDAVDKGGQTYMQARPNVILELGLCIESCDGRVLFLRRDGCNVFSDIDGIIRIEYKTNIHDSFLELQSQFKQFNII
jgi:predicted nucleotide-binding protein